MDNGLFQPGRLLVAATDLQCSLELVCRSKSTRIIALSYTPSFCVIAYFNVSTLMYRSVALVISAVLYPCCSDEQLRVIYF